MRAPRIALSALALATAAACAPPPAQTSSAGTSPQPASSSPSMAGMTHYSATLAPVGGSAVHGTATIHSMGNRQTVELQITGAPAAATLPWHIHSGSCADGPGAVVGDPASYTALGTSSDGSASLMIDLPITLSADKRYHVNVHASPSNMGTIVACGDLSS